MLKHFLATGFRLLWKRKAFTLINLAGLATGISAALVIFLIAHYEFSYDKFEPNRERIYHVVLDVRFPGMEGHSAAVPAPLGSAISRDIAGVEAVVPLQGFQGDGSAKVTIAGNKKEEPVVYKKQDAILFTTDAYFNLLASQWLAGNTHAALQQPFSVVLSESRARQYFPNTAPENIIGKEVVYNDSLRTTVTGIVKDITAATNFTSKEFISLPTITATGLKKEFMTEVWDDWMAYSQLYIKLLPGQSAANTEKQLNALFRRHNPRAEKDAANSQRLHLQPLQELHFDGNYAGVGITIANKSTLYGLLAIAAFLLLLAGINFINLTTAQAAQRAKEIGVRKTMGSSKQTLLLQFIGETLLLTAMATLLSTLITPLLLHAFADFIPPGLRFNLFETPGILLFLAGLTIVVAVLAGFYPALVLAAYQPARVLRDQSYSTMAQTRSGWLRKTLTVTQFVIAQFFVICTLLVSKQIHYALNKDLGFNKEAILSFDIPHRDTVPAHRVQLLQQIKNIAGVQNASMGFQPPAMQGAAFGNISYHNGKEELSTNVQIRWGDSNYLKIYGVRLLAGRNVANSDTIKEFLINETYAHFLGFQHPVDALGHYLTFNGKRLIPIVGVMADFHEQSLRSPIGPVAFGSMNSRSYTFHIALRPHHTAGSNWPATLAAIRKAFQNIYPEDDFDYHFFDQTIAAFYKTEQNTSRLLQWATGLTIFISCLGLLGLVLYTTNTRTREIGIRKVFGASVMQIVTLLSKDFIRLVGLAFIIAVPAAWYVLNKWLEGFAYRTGLSWWVFTISGVFMLLIALLTLSVQTIRSATVNPVKSLRT